MKIAFIGSHGVGKTTLCFELAARLKRLEMSVDLVKEVARSCPLPINRDTTLDAQRWILYSQIAQEIAAASHFEAVICDRSVLDNYAYLVHRVGPQAEMEPLVERWVGTYSALIKVPVLRPPSFDGTRDTNAEFQRDIDRLIDRLVVRFPARVHRLEPQRSHEWVADTLGFLGLPTEPPQIDLFGEER